MRSPGATRREPNAERGTTSRFTATAMRRSARSSERSSAATVQPGVTARGSPFTKISVAPSDTALTVPEGGHGSGLEMRTAQTYPRPPGPANFPGALGSPGAPGNLDCGTTFAPR